MANKKKKKNKKHVNRRKRETTQAVQVETQLPEVQRFLTKRSLICGLIILLCILVFCFLPDSWLDNFIMRTLELLSLGGIVLALGILFYLNYTEKTVKVLYWTVVLSSILSLYLITCKAWMLIEFLLLSILTIYACVVYMRDNQKGTRKYAKVGKRRKITLNSFWPIGLCLVFRAILLYVRFSMYEYIDNLAILGVGTAIGLVLALILIVWLCSSGYKYLERKGSESHSTALTAFLIFFTCIIFGWFSVAIPNQSFVIEQKVISCEVLDKDEKIRRSHQTRSLCVEIKGDEYYIEVTSETFEQFNIGDTISVEVSKGLFGLEYLYIP